MDHNSDATMIEIRRAYQARRLFNHKEAIRAEWPNASAPTSGAMTAPSPINPSSNRLSPAVALSICNKLTLLNWLPDVHENEQIGAENSTKAVCAAIWDMWRQNFPGVDFGFNSPGRSE